LILFFCIFAIYTENTNCYSHLYEFRVSSIYIQQIHLLISSELICQDCGQVLSGGGNRIRAGMPRSIVRYSIPYSYCDLCRYLAQISKSWPIICITNVRLMKKLTSSHYAASKTHIRSHNY
jgi:hypothetical protein